MIKINKLLLIAGVFIFLVNASFAQKIYKPYDFPVKPGTPEWAEFDSHSEMIAASQIPYEQLTQMTTSALIITCIHYPLFGDLFAYNDFQTGFDRMAANFNGLVELLQRKDLATEALQVYKSFSDLGQPHSEDSDTKLRFMYLEMLLCQPQVIQNLDNKSKRGLLSEALKKQSSKMNFPQHYDLFQLTPSSLLMARVTKLLAPGKLESAQQGLKGKLERFASKPFVADSETVNIIANVSNDILRKK